MSTDVYLQSFSDHPEDRRSEVRGVLAAFLDRAEENLVTVDGSAAVYGLHESPLTSVMFNHIDGDRVWDVIFELAVTAEWAILPIDGRVCIPSPRLLTTVPADLHASPGVAVIASGFELRNEVAAIPDDSAHR